jgi:hypothetical protein
MSNDASFLGAVSDDGRPVLPDDATGAGSEPDAGQAPATGSGDVPGPSEPPGPEPMFLVLEDWVIDYFLPMFRRTLGGEYRWCAQWWRHDEAISRLTSLWHAWEVLRRKPGTGIATWYREHLDHQLPILMGARGPFYQCSETSHRESHEAIAMPSPDEWWDTGHEAAALGHAPLPIPSSGPGGGEIGA